MSTRISMSFTSMSIALGLAGLTFLLWKRQRNRSGKNSLNSLIIKIVTTREDCDDVIAQFRRLCCYHRSVGFDCEWVSDHGKRLPVALLQLSSFDGLCALFRLNELKTIPQSLKEFLEDERIFKIGVAPFDDGKYLFQDYGTKLASSLDLRHVVHMCGYPKGGVAFLAKSRLGVTLDKSWRIRCSDWEAEELSERQVKYAAADAYVAIKIFVDLINNYKRRGFFSLLFSWDKPAGYWANLDVICQQYADVSFKSKQSIHEKTASQKEVKLAKKYPHATRSKPLYHNCFLQAPDGELLCTCDNKKARWYVLKELADVIQEEPLIVRLRFEPAGRSVGEVGRYYQLTKENKCVVCGGTNSYIRKNIVPREYRKFFPEVMKDHSSHDIVLLCVSCHQRSNMRDQQVRNELAVVCNAPISQDGEYARFIEDVDIKKVRSAARALQSKKHLMPEERRKELEQTLLRQYPNYEVVTDELLKMAMEEQTVFENLQYESHGSKVVDHYLEKEGGLLKLEELWRQHFLSTMKPKFMPELWSITHNEERLRVRFAEGRLSKQDMAQIGLSGWF